MTVREDRRIIRTKQLLKDKLLDLISENGMDQVTVKELTERAGLNRGTFYLHYRDIQDFCEQYTEEMLHGYQMIIRKLELSANCHSPDIEPPAGFVRPFDYILENKRFFSVFLGPGGDSTLEIKLRRLIQDQLHRSYRVSNQFYGEIPAKQQYLFAYLSSAYSGSIRHWIMQGLDLSPKEMAVLFAEISQLGSSNL